jgi:trehalose 6-phosphate synthase
VSRLVVVSNRLPVFRQASDPEAMDIPAGGLASAVFTSLRRVPGSLWLGWNGRVEPAERAGRPTRSRVGGVALIGLPLTPREQADYYQGYCNGALWPLFHCFQGRIHIDLRQEACYRAVQARFAAALRPLLLPGDLVWVQDYHFLLLGRELRRLGWAGRTGFFLHVPFPPYDLWQLLPDPRDVLAALGEYDLVGFQTRGSLDNYRYCGRRLLGDGADDDTDGGADRDIGRRHDAGVYPVGIDPEEFRAPADDDPRRRRRGALARVVRGRRLILGVDRLDYTKGIPERILAYEEFLARHPEWRKKVSLVQIASPSRTAATQYVEQKRLLDYMVGRVNGELAEHDWVPIRYLYRSYARAVLARFYREADVGLVTPLRDGMNLVAKEFVAAQSPAAPGVLVLSRSAGAADDLDEAVIVNPFVPADVADGVARALAMPLPERLDRHRALLARVRENSVHAWSRRFLADLEGRPATGLPAHAAVGRLRRPGRPPMA